MLLVFRSVKSALLDHGSYVVLIFSSIALQCNMQLSYVSLKNKVYISVALNIRFIFSLLALPVSLHNIVYPTSLLLQNVHFIPPLSLCKMRFISHLSPCNVKVIFPSHLETHSSYFNSHTAICTHLLLLATTRPMPLLPFSSIQIKSSVSSQIRFIFSLSS